MTWLVLILLGLASCRNLPSEPLETEQKTPLLNYGFENGVLSPWEGQFRPENSAFSEDQPKVGRYCGQFHLGAGGDYWTSPNNGGQSARSEIQVSDSAPVDQELYYSWYLRIGADTVEDPDWQVVGQFHDQPDVNQGETWSTYPAHSPPLSYKYKDRQLIVAVYDWGKGQVMDIASVALAKGEWHQIVTKVKWSEGNEGTVECWLDGKAVTAPNGQSRYQGRNCFNSAGNYLKIGLYRSKDILTAATVYFDEIKIGSSPEEVL